jgi:segregation and condensation protein B
MEASPAAEGASATNEASEAIDEKKMARQRDRQARQLLQGILDELMADYINSERGMEIREIAGGYRMATKPEYHDVVRGFVKSLKPPMKLSLQALETLAVIAYKQPVTAPEVSEIRGVDSGGVLGSLVSRKLVTTAGRKPVIGRPILYKTTKEFLLRFGLKDVNDLPSMEEFEKMAGELVEPEVEGGSQEQVPSSVEPEAAQKTLSEQMQEQPPDTRAAESQTEELLVEESVAEELPVEEPPAEEPPTAEVAEAPPTTEEPHREPEP